MAFVAVGRRTFALLIGASGTIAAAALGGAAPSAATTNCGGSSGLPATSLYHPTPWAQRALNFERAWPITEGAGVTVAVIDTGVDGSQPFLKGAVLPGFDVVNGGGVADTDCNGHGTLVAGLIAGRHLPGFGFAGVAPEARILPIREANSTGNSTAQVLAKCIIAAVDRHAQVINVSITAALPSVALDEAVQYAIDKNVLVVAAAGNDFQQGNGPQYPADQPGVLAVGAVDAAGQRAGFSEAVSYVAVVAPGTDVIGPGAGNVGLVSNSGTSFATAYVSGVAALVRSYYPHMPVPQVIRRIEATADHPPGSLPTPGLGWGEVDPYQAVTAVLPREARTSVPAARSVGLPPSPPARSGAGETAMGVAFGGTALAVAILLSGQVVARGRRRGWRPGA
jgi:type VII secretion-associated serine protease mycosin